MENKEQKHTIMGNTLVRDSFYKSKAIMMFELSLGVRYNVVTPFLYFKFADRDDAKSPGRWNDDNCYWITNVTSIRDFEVKLNKLLRAEECKDEKIEFKNPMKGTYLGIRCSFDDRNKIQYYMFTYSRGKDFKVTASLTRDECVAFYMTIKNFIETYFSTAQLILNRNDVWFDLYGKNKKSSYSNSSSGSYKKNDIKKSDQKNDDKKPDDDKQFMSNIENDIKNYGSSIDDDVPF